GALDAAKSGVSERFEVGRQRLVASSSREDVSITEPPSGHVEYGDVVGISVRVDAGNEVERSRAFVGDFVAGCCHDGTVPSSEGTSARSRAAKTLTGLTRLV